MKNEKGRFLVRCRVSRGFFDTELLVIVAESSAYVSRENVKFDGELKSGEIEGLVSAYVIETSGEKTLIELPGQPVVGGARAWVPKGDVSAAA